MRKLPELAKNTQFMSSLPKSLSKRKCVGRMQWRQSAKETSGKRMFADRFNQHNSSGKLQFNYNFFLTTESKNKRRTGCGCAGEANADAFQE